MSVWLEEWKSGMIKIGKEIKKLEDKSFFFFFSNVFGWGNVKVQKMKIHGK